MQTRAHGFAPCVLQGVFVAPASHLHFALLLDNRLCTHDASRPPAYTYPPTWPLPHIHHTHPPHPQLRPEDMSATVRYPSTDEVEDVNLLDLINEKQVSVSEWRGGRASREQRGGGGIEWG